MEAQRCPNGHYFDPVQYAVCPYCKPAEPPVAPACDVGATMPLRSEGFTAAPPAPDPDKTVRLAVKELGVDPVVGWLVCVDGPDKGRDFRLRVGNNYLGRAPEMDISLRGDTSISRENHAVVSYDARHKNFYIAMGTGREILYVSSQPLQGSRMLERLDRIEVGATTLLFVPLCGEGFDWQ